MGEDDIISQEGVAVLQDLIVHHGKGVKVQWAAMCRFFGFDAATTAAIHATAVAPETAIQGQALGRPVAPVQDDEWDEGRQDAVEPTESDEDETEDETEED